ncbi:MAG TPA: PAS domain S-box protein [Longimicrobium sp.]|nr:PAS domain S-box protein [Longimicrobium sp.]
MSRPPDAGAPSTPHGDGGTGGLDILEHAADAFVALDGAWRLTYVNPVAATLAGRPRGELLGHPLWERFPALAGGEAERALRRAAREGVVVELHHPLAEGGAPMELRAFPTPDGLAVYARDVGAERRAEAAVRESEARFRALADTAPVMIWLSDPQNLGTYFNRPWLQFTGRTLEEELGTGWTRALHPDDLPRAVEHCSAAFEARREFRMEFRMRRADGAYRWVLDHGIPRYDDAGAFLGYVGSCIDITDLRAASDALREREERYRLVMRATRDVVWDWDLATNRVRWNEAIEEVMGHAPADVEPTARWWYGHIHPDDRDRVVLGIHEAIRLRAAQWSAEYRFLRAGGEWAHVLDRGYLLRGDDGRPVRMIGAMQDVTGRKRAEAARESERERLRRVLAQLPAAVAVYEGPELVVVAASDAYHRFVGGRDLLGRPFRDALPELAAQGFDRLLEDVYRSGRPHVGTGVDAAWDDDGDGAAEPHVIDFVYQPLVGADGAVYGVVAHVTDVTARHRAERELAEARAEAEARAAEGADLARRLAEQAMVLRAQVEESRSLAAELRTANEGLVAASRSADASRRRIELLAEASSRLASSLDFRETVRTVAQLAVPALADWCFVETQDDTGAIRLLAAGHADPAKVEWAFEVMRRYPIDPDAPYGTANVLRTGEPEVVFEIPDGLLDAAARDEEHRAIYRAVAFRSHISVPLTVAGRTFGVLSLVYGDESGRRYTADDLPLARELAHRAAVAIENARLYGEALAANRAKAGFLATMSHELRTPLNAVTGYADLLLLGIPEPIPERARAQVERILLAARHLLSIIEEILAYSRLEAGRETIELEAVDLAALAGEVGAIIEPLAAVKGLAVHLPERVEPATVVTDPRKLRQILVNLLGNAVKFTAAGSVSFGVEGVDGAVLLHVRDTGIGIEPAHREVIFEPFRQVDDASTRVAGGTGLGLSVSRSLARLLGGDVTVESVPGEGSTFTVRLPRA